VSASHKFLHNSNLLQIPGSVMPVIEASLTLSFLYQSSRRLSSSVPPAIWFLILHLTCFIVENVFSHVCISKHILLRNISVWEIYPYWLIFRGSLHYSLV